MPFDSAGFPPEPTWHQPDPAPVSLIDLWLGAAIFTGAAALVAIAGCAGASLAVHAWVTR